MIIIKNDIIKIIIITIIITLLLFVCVFIRKKDNKSPYVDIKSIEITCDDGNCSFKKKKNPKTSDALEANSFTENKNIISWHDFSEVKLFDNSIYQIEGEIGPESRNVYCFTLKNSTNFRFNYNISFNETNPCSINMKYKLKKNGKYLISEYTSFNGLNISEQLLEAKENDLFDLEWVWISSNHDDDIEKCQENYHLKMQVEAESIND